MTGIEHLFLNRSRRARKRLAWILAAILLLPVGLLFYASWDMVQVASWMQIPCTIQRSEVHIAESETERDPYEFKVLYQYEVGGVVVNGERFRRSWGSTDARFSDATAAYRLEGQFPPGSRNTCFVNPKNPTESVLTRENPIGVIGVTAAVTLLGAAFIWFYIEYGQEQPKHLRQRGDRQALWVFLLIFVAIYIWWAGWPLVRTVAALNWRRTPCAVIRSCVRYDKVEDQHGQFWLSQADVLYGYRVHGTDYRSNRLSFVEGKGLWESRPRLLALQLPTGLRTECFVNPRDPTQAILRHDLEEAILVAVLPILLAVIAFAGAVPLLRHAFGVRRPAIWANTAVAIAAAIMAARPTVDLLHAPGTTAIQDTIFIIILWLTSLGCAIAVAILLFRFTDTHA